MRGSSSWPEIHSGTPEALKRKAVLAVLVRVCSSPAGAKFSIAAMGEIFEIRKPVVRCPCLERLSRPAK